MRSRPLSVFDRWRFRFRRAISVAAQHGIDLDLHEHLGIDRLAAQQRIRRANVGEIVGVGAGDRLRVLKIPYEDAGPNDIAHQGTGFAERSLNLAQHVAGLAGGVDLVLRGARGVDGGGAGDEYRVADA
jgi:hypothetical protein